jgi:hypothetical protein
LFSLYPALLSQKLKKEVEYFLNKIVKNTKIKFDKKYSEKKKYLMLIDIYKEVKEDYFK